MELRFNQHPAKLDGQAITGYASVFYNKQEAGTEYTLTNGVVERIAPTAFNQAILKSTNVQARYNHDDSFTLGNVETGTLRLQVDARGLKYIIPFDAQDPQHIAVARKIEKGLIKGSSFAFVPKKVKWSREGEKDIATVEDLDLYDVGPVNRGAYPAATALVASDIYSKQHELWLKTLKHREFLNQVT